MSHGSGARRLIVNADDFGQSVGVNEGVIQCHERGIVTSASLMVRWPAATAAADYARAEPTLSAGLHIDLGEWAYRDGEWAPLYHVAAPDDPDAITAEIARQLETFRQLMRCDPTHIDSHQHVHRWDTIAEVVREVGEQLGVPVRQCTGEVAYLGGFYGQGGKGEVLDGAISVEHLIQILTTLPEGTTELGCHPGLRRDAPGMYVVEREQEVQVLCDRQVRATIQAERIELISFRGVAVAKRACG